MHILLTNDDGPPDGRISPYVHAFALKLAAQPGVTLSIAVPDGQRSWIGKAHIHGETITAEFLYPDSNVPTERFSEPQPELAKKYQEWGLLSGNPATCANIGCQLLYRERGPVDLVISGPNYGRNTSAPYILSSGTVGASMEAAMCSVRSIALSFSYCKAAHTEQEIDQAIEASLGLIRQISSQWHQQVQVYTINIPLGLLTPKSRVRYLPIFEGGWGDVYDAILPSTDSGKKATKFKWNPKFHLCDQKVLDGGPGSDAWHVMNGDITVTPLRASFAGIPELHGIEHEIPHLSLDESGNHVAKISTTDKYVTQKLTEALKRHKIDVVLSNKLEDTDWLQYIDYDETDFDARAKSKATWQYSYVYRKGLIRKNLVARTAAYFVAKNPDSELAKAFPQTFSIEVDYAEFLDDALDEACELRHALDEDPQRTWILKPALADRAHGIRVFRGVDGLQKVFDDFEANNEGEEDSDGVVASDLRQFVVQEYMANPMLCEGRKFHLRVYVLAVGNIQVLVHNEYLVLLAGEQWPGLQGDELVLDSTGHITNTCHQQGTQPESKLVKAFSDLDLSPEMRKKIRAGVNGSTADIFSAALADPVNFQPLENAFELYGVDFLVDSEGGVQLLEINAFPDFSQTGEKLGSIVDSVFESTVATLLKEPTDALQLVLIVPST